MYRVLLHKCSVPAWTKEFASVNEARKELLLHICSECLQGNRSFVGEGGNIETEFQCDEPPNIYEINELLSTACGLEYDVEELD